MTTTIASASRLLNELTPDLQVAALNLAKARAAFEHSPDAVTTFWLETAHTRMNLLLDTLLSAR